MKKTHTLFGGELSSGAYGSYAHYLVSYVRALHKRGIALASTSPGLRIERRPNAD
jgi:O-glycosyl hydrolase